jgi:hypothetical protein
MGLSDKERPIALDSSSFRQTANGSKAGVSRTASEFHEVLGDQNLAGKVLAHLLTPTVVRVF